MFDVCWVDSSIPTHSREISNQELNEVERLKKELKEANIKLNLAQKIILKSNRSVNVLKKHIKRLTQMKNNSKTPNYLRLESLLKQLFNDDQIRALMRPSSRGHMWSNDTIKKALRLKYACGSSGYEELLKQKYPLPCERTLQRKLENIQFQEGICDDIFKLLEDKVTQFKDVRERDCSLVLDEMSIVPGQQFDPSTQSYYGTASFCTRKGIKMPACCVSKCLKRTKKGIKIFMARFPTNPERRDVWIANIGKHRLRNWKSTTDLFICETHFANNMWEKVRDDGEKKLKGNAVPTIFPAQLEISSTSISTNDKNNESSQRQSGVFETFNVHQDKQQEDCLGADVPDIIPLTSSNVANPITIYYSFCGYKIRLTIIYHYVTHYL